MPTKEELVELKEARISREKAAQRLDMTLEQFDALLREHDICWKCRPKAGSPPGPGKPQARRHRSRP